MHITFEKLKEKRALPHSNNDRVSNPKIFYDILVKSKQVCLSVCIFSAITYITVRTLTCSADPTRFLKYHCEKYRNSTYFPSVKIFVKRDNFCTRKLCETTGFYDVSVWPFFIMHERVRQFFFFSVFSTCCGKRDSVNKIANFQPSKVIFHIFT